MRPINAIVIVYDGREMNEADAAVLNLALRQAGLMNDADDAVIKYFDKDGIVDQVVKDTPTLIKKLRLGLEEATSISEPVKNAIVFLGTMFAEDLKFGKTSGDYSQLAIQLTLHRNDTNVKNAVEILATSKTDLPAAKNVLHKYNMSHAAISTIRKVYNTVLF